MAENPFLADRGQQLAMLLMSLGAGVSNAANNGRPGWSGISDGVATYANAFGRMTPPAPAAASDARRDTSTAATESADPVEGYIAIHPGTGRRFLRRNGRWTPL